MINFCPLPSEDAGCIFQSGVNSMNMTKLKRQTGHQSSELAAL